MAERRPGPDDDPVLARDSTYRKPGSVNQPADTSDGIEPDWSERQDDGSEPDDDPARAALASARGTSRTSGRGRAGLRRRRRPDEPGRNRGGYSAPGPDPVRDPQRLGDLLPGYVADLGWEQPMADARVFAQWASLVGAEVAAHCEPQSLRDGELRITAESTAWATQLRLLAGTLLARLVAELGPHVVTRLVISGPTTPSWKHGPRSLRNGRGPRDTYG